VREPTPYTECEPLLYSIKDAAKRLGLCRATIYNILSEDDPALVSVKIGNRRLITAASIRALASNGSKAPL
jgi:hypothetical protein